MTITQRAAAFAVAAGAALLLSTPAHAATPPPGGFPLGSSASAYSVANAVAGSIVSSL
ncbi:hypothetical protein [Streptomyces sp. NPDC050738]|uniref:hypothetical protein n=1 Tax=Streptomyces sp. NPDC050738 TaxID=3154744 RepID=UPI00343E679F